MTWTNPTLIAWGAALVLAAWLRPRQFQNGAMACVGLAFLGVTSPVSLLVLAGLGTLGYLLARNSRGKTWRVLVVVGAAIAGIVFFKWDTRLGSSTAGRVVPLGLAFYSLRVLHFSLEAYSGRLPAHGARDFARYLLFLPTQPAGPINRFPEFLRDSRRRRWDPGLFALGLERILYGYVKIVVLGNGLASRWLGGHLVAFDAHCDWTIEYLRCLQYGANLYFQFAGYSDVAIGLALLVGYRVPENFNWPFLARNIADFWRRWHMTLAGWCRDYVFGPVSAWTRNAYLGVISSMLILGLWHEITPRYLIWGLYHGAGIALLRAFQSFKPRLGLPDSPAAKLLGSFLAWALTMNFVILGFAITKEESLSGAWRAIVTLLTLREYGHA